MQYAKVERNIAGRTLSFETGAMARQSAGAVVARMGDTVVLSAITVANPREGIDFFPLTVEYREKVYSAGKFPGGFIKREGRPTNKEILTCRLIDRPIRPLFPEEFNNEIQVFSTVLSVDKENEPDVLAMNASFAGMLLAPVPFKGPVAAVRVARINGDYVPFPSPEQINSADMDVVVAGSRDAIMMVEAGASEVGEEDFLGALDFGRDVIDELLDMMVELRDRAKPDPSEWVAPASKPAAFERAKRDFRSRMQRAYETQGKKARNTALEEVKKAAMEALAPAGAPDYEELKKQVKKGLVEAEYEVVREMVLEGRRVDLRGERDIRPITISTGLLPRTHGSALFTRGETQALVVTTLGTLRDQQIVDGLMEEYSKKFDLQYNFPPYSTGEVKPIRGTSRREIGHGNLAERALIPVIPADEEFPYTLRVVSEVLESNGSSSMASVCGATLSLMDAGCPLRQPVAGIAMGLIKEGERIAILSDILGTEDHLGDMDFKVAGTGRGITAVQMDIKIAGITREIMSRALDQAREGRLFILKKMLEAMPMPRERISEFAPRLLIVKIPQEKIGMVIGPGGKMIKKIQEETGAQIDIGDDGTINISCTDAAGAENAKQQIEWIVADVEIGKIYDAKVVSIKDFGAFVEVLPGQEALCHVSEIAEGYVNSVADVVKIGDTLRVKVILKDDQGRIKVSARAAMAEDRGESYTPPERGGRGGDRGDRGDRGPRRFGRDRDRGGDRGFDRGGDRGPDRGPDRGADRPEGGDRPDFDRDRDAGGGDRDGGGDRGVERTGGGEDRPPYREHRGGDRGGRGGGGGGGGFSRPRGGGGGYGRRGGGDRGDRRY
jgi:polyribonucleotide nucleotidyltransferase